MKRAADDEALDGAPAAKAARLEVDAVVGASPSSNVDDVLGRLFVDEVAAGRWTLGTFAALRERYPKRKPVYKSARVTVTIPNPWGADGKDDNTLLPLQAAEFLDLLKPSTSRTRSKHDYVTVHWGDEVDWDYSESEPRCSADTWEKEGLDEWNDEVGEEDGWAAYRYFLAHYGDPDRDERVAAMLKQ